MFLFYIYLFSVCLCRDIILPPTNNNKQQNVYILTRLEVKKRIMNNVIYYHQRDGQKGGEEELLLNVIKRRLFMASLKIIFLFFQFSKCFKLFPEFQFSQTIFFLFVTPMCVVTLAL